MKRAADNRRARVLDDLIETVREIQEQTCMNLGEVAETLAGLGPPRESYRTFLARQKRARHRRKRPPRA